MTAGGVPSGDMDVSRSRALGRSDPVGARLRTPSLARDALEQSDQAEVAERVGELGAPGRLEVGQEIERSRVVGAVAGSAERRHAVGVVAAAERAGREVRRVDPSLGAARASTRAASSSDSPLFSSPGIARAG